MFPPYFVAQAGSEREYGSFTRERKGVLNLGGRMWKGVTCFSKNVNLDMVPSDPDPGPDSKAVLDTMPSDSKTKDPRWTFTIPGLYEVEMFHEFSINGESNRVSICPIINGSRVPVVSQSCGHLEIGSSLDSKYTNDVDNRTLPHITKFYYAFSGGDTLSFVYDGSLWCHVTFLSMSIKLIDVGV